MIGTDEPALCRRVVPEIGIVESSFASSGIALIAGEFPFIGGSCFVPRLSKRKLPKGARPGARGVGFCTVGEMIRMVVCGGVSGDGDQHLAFPKRVEHPAVS